MIRYLHLDTANAVPPVQAHQPFKAVVIGDRPTAPDLRTAMCAWLNAAGCLYLMAWGTDARAWQEGVNLANLQAWDFGTIPDNRLIISTAHEQEELSEVFWFAKYTAMHPCATLDDVWLVHCAAAGRQTEIVELYEEA